MAYCTVDDIQRILPASITIGDKNIGTPVPGQPTGKDNFTDIQVQRYINYAEQQIDSRLRPFYSTPLRRVKTYETELEAAVTAGSNVSISVRDSAAFLPGTLVRLQDKESLETATVSSVTNLTTIILSSVQNNYSIDRGLISVLEFPDPVNIMATRLTVSFLFDRLFSAEQSPDMSDYGKSQRNQARNDLGAILTGEILLFGQEHTGRRFVRGTLLDAFGSPAEVNKTEENE